MFSASNKKSAKMILYVEYDIIEIFNVDMMVDDHQDLVLRPLYVNLADLKSFPSETNIIIPL